MPRMSRVVSVRPSPFVAWHQLQREFSYDNKAWLSSTPAWVDPVPTYGWPSRQIGSPARLILHMGVPPPCMYKGVRFSISPIASISTMNYVAPNKDISSEFVQIRQARRYQRHEWDGKIYPCQFLGLCEMIGSWASKRATQELKSSHCSAEDISPAV